MAAPALVTDIAQSQVGQSESFPTKSHTNSYFRTFKKTFIQYVDSNMDANGFTVGSTGTANATWDNGYQIIPYRFPISSMTSQDQTQHFVNGAAFKVHSLGFKVHAFKPMVEQTKVTGGTGIVESIYNSNPMLMVLKDSDGVYEYSTVTPTGGRDFYKVNKNMTRPLPQSQVEGTLSRAVQLIEHYDKTLTPDPFATMTEMWGHDLNFVTAGEGFGHTWHNANPVWYPCGEQITRADVLPNPISADWKYTQIGAVEYTQESEVNMNNPKFPPNVFVRVILSTVRTELSIKPAGSLLTITLRSSSYLITVVCCGLSRELSRI